MERILSKRAKKYKEVILFVMPAFLPLLVFWIYPMVQGLYISFTDYDFMSSSYNIVGFRNYKNIFNDEMFYKALRNTIIFTMGNIVPTIFGGLSLALIVNKKMRCSSLYKSIIFSPWVTPTVAVSIVWSWVFEPNTGLANYILQLLDMPKLKWLESSETAMFSLIIVTVWKGLGWAMVFYLNAIERISKDLYEAASIDGATSLEVFKYITIPLISPTTLFLTIITTVNSIQAYDQIQVLTQGGPAGSTRTLLYMYYQTAFENFNIGEAMALAMIILIIVGFFSLIQFLISKTWIHY